MSSRPPKVGGGRSERWVSRDELERLAGKTVELLAEHFSSLSEGPVAPQVSPDELRRLFSGSFPRKGTGIDAVFEELAEKVLRNSTKVGSRRFFGLMDPPPLPVAIFADMVTSGLNQNLANWATSPAATLVELQVVKWFCELAGLEDGGGLVVSSGSVANLLGLRLARNWAVPGAAENGLGGQGLDVRPCVYGSEQCHSSLEKAMDVLGLGRENLRRIETDDELRMRVDCLEEAAAEDVRDGKLPVCVVATAGTTLTGTIDPLGEMAEVCRKRGLWFHVDASYGGAALLSEQGRRLLWGISEADSISIDPHKWLYIPFQAALLLVRHNHKKSMAFARSTSYIYEAPGGAINLSDYGIQGSKRFDALKIWLAMKALGGEGYERLIDKDVDNARYFYDLLQGCEYFKARQEPQLGLVLFRYLPQGVEKGTALSLDEEAWVDEATKELHQLIMESGRVWLGLIGIKGRVYLQAYFGNYLMEREDVDFLYSVLGDFARDLR